MALLVTAPVPRGPKFAHAYWLQNKLAGWNVHPLPRVSALEGTMEGLETVASGPIVILSRHASIAETPLPALLIASRPGLGCATA